MLRFNFFLISVGLFTDGLILLIQHGKKDLIAWWPQVMEEFNTAKTHYEKLKIEDRIQIDMHEGVHEAIIESGIKFMTKWIGLDSNKK